MGKWKKQCNKSSRISLKNNSRSRLNSQADQYQNKTYRQRWWRFTKNQFSGSLKCNTRKLSCWKKSIMPNLCTLWEQILGRRLLEILLSHLTERLKTTSRLESYISVSMTSLNWKCSCSDLFNFFGNTKTLTKSFIALCSPQIIK